MTGWLRVKGAAEYASVCERTIYSWIRQGLPFSRIGNCTLIRVANIDEFLEKHRQEDDAGRIVTELINSL